MKNHTSDASRRARVRRRIAITCLIICSLAAALNLAVMIAGHSTRWTVVLFCVEFSGVLSSIANLRSMRGQR